MRRQGVADKPRRSKLAASLACHLCWPPSASPSPIMQHAAHNCTVFVLGLSHNFAFILLPRGCLATTSGWSERERERGKVGERHRADAERTPLPGVNSFAWLLSDSINDKLKPRRTARCASSQTSVSIYTHTYIYM